MPLFSRTRKLDTPFSDQLAPRLTCSDMMKLVVAIEGSDEESSIADELPADHALDMYVDKTSTDTQAIIVISEVNQYAAVVFRSTEYDNLDDWKLNLSISKVSFGPVAPSNAKVHSGFWNCAIGNGLGDVFESRLKELMNDSSLKLNMVYIAGHSMGGACAHIFGTSLAANNSDMKVRVVTFGEPKIGNQNFKTWSQYSGSLDNLSVFRFVNRADAVPRIALPGYRTSGHLFQIWRSSSQLFYNQDQGGEYKTPPKSWKGGLSIRQHYNVEYLNFFENKSHRSAFWPTSFSLACAWWKLWC